MDAGCNMVYVAMYDEVDEGTAIYKVAENDAQTPTTGTFVPLDFDGYDLPSDWFLRLTGEATKMLRGEIALTSTIPIVATVSDAIILSQDLPASMTPGETVTVQISVQNTGQTSWTKAAGFQLGSQNSQDNTTWGRMRVELEDGETIAPGASKTFSFDITAPSEENTYHFRWRMMQEDVNWFGRLTENILIKVDSDLSMLDDCDATTDWNSSGTVVLNTAEQKQGTACLEFTGSATDEFTKVLADPYVSGLSENNALFQFWYYVSDASALQATTRIEMGSAGKANEDLYFWIVDDLESGWNLMSLSMQNAYSIGAPNLDAINWLSIQNAKSSSITTRMDELQLLDLNADAEIFQLTVVNGRGSGSYVNHATAVIIADEAPIGQRFDAWIVQSGNPIFANNKSATASLIIHGGDVEVSASYKDAGNYLDDCDEKLDWRDASRISLNTTDHIQGASCIEFTGDNSPEFYKIFDPPYKTGLTQSNAAIQFLYYVSDISKFEDSNQVEIGSAGKSDEDEYNWKLTNLKVGWNFFSLRFRDASSSGNPDLNDINWFRLYHKKTGTITTRLDAVRIVDINTTSMYTLGVEEGAGSGSYYENQLVNIHPTSYPQGMVFDTWRVVSGDVYIDEPNAPYTFVVMRDGNATIEASFKELSIGIENAHTSDFSFEVYPNPARTRLSVGLQLDEAADVDVHLLDLSGRIIDHHMSALSLSSGENTLTMPVLGIMPGTYIVKVSVSGNSYTKLVSIQ